MQVPQNFALPTSQQITANQTKILGTRSLVRLNVDKNRRPLWSFSANSKQSLPTIYAEDVLDRPDSNSSREGSYFVQGIPPAAAEAGRGGAAAAGGQGSTSLQGMDLETAAAGTAAVGAVNGPSQQLVPPVKPMGQLQAAMLTHNSLRRLSGTSAGTPTAAAAAAAAAGAGGGADRGDSSAGHLHARGGGTFMGNRPSSPSVTELMRVSTGSRQVGGMPW